MKNRFRLLALVSIYLIFNTLQLIGQEAPKTKLADKFFYGGNLGLQFGNLTYIDISPLVGYKITEKLHTGIGATYIYYRYKDLFGKFETSIYGGRVFGRYYALENLFGHVEYEVLNLGVPDELSGPNYNKLVRRYINSVLVGAGYTQPIGNRSALTLMLLFNLTEAQYSPYQNPIIRIGFNAGF